MSDFHIRLALEVFQGRSTTERTSARRMPSVGRQRRRCRTKPAHWPGNATCCQRHGRDT